jgi:formate dehydrogenase (coenzyme F420) beta subunit
MVVKAILEINEGKIVESLRDFLKSLLKKKQLEALLVPLEIKDRVVMTLVSDPNRLEMANPFAPLMTRNSAQIVSDITKVTPSQKKIGVVLRPCELRALVELVKLKQVSLENLTLIGIDCLGTLSSSNYKEFNKSFNTERYLKSGPDSPDWLRTACQICEYPAPLNADISIGLIGMDLDRGLLVQAEKPEAEKMIKALGLRAAEESELGVREPALIGLKAKRTEARDKYFSRLKTEVVGLDNLLSTLASCVNCHNCRVMCPICYCKECFFDSATFEWESEKLVGRAKKKGALKMPADTLLYHLTRLNHMAASCVSCGMCEEACPQDIRVFDIFKLVGDRIQKEFDYVPGRSLDEEPPLTVFREDELGEIEK